MSHMNVRSYVCRSHCVVLEHHVVSKSAILGSYCKTIQVKWSRYRSGAAQRVGRGIALLFHDRGARRGWVVSSTPRPHFTSGKDPVPILQEAGWAPGPVWRAENLVPTGIRYRTFQPVVSRYTDWAIRPTYLSCSLRELKTRNLWRHMTKVSLFIKGHNKSYGSQWTAGIEMRSLTG